jgi:hypothetical protein
MEMTMLSMTNLRCKGIKVSSQWHISIVLSCLLIFIYANSLFLLGMPDGDAMEDEITEESGKLFFFLQYLDKQ